MSSLRVESLRVCWIEAFVAVVDEENMSAAARKLGLSQPTVSRYLQDLQEWCGKQLIEPGGIRDPEYPGISVAVTSAGRKLYKRAGPALRGLRAFRTPEALAKEQICALKLMVGKMLADLTGKKPSATALFGRATIENLAGLVEGLGPEAPLDALTELNHSVRTVFADYERDLLKERRTKRKGPGRSVAIASLTV